MVITYPLLTIVDDSGTVVSGATVAITSVTDKAGTAIPSPGATVNLAGANVSVDYDAEVKGEAWVVLAISKVGSTFTGLNAAPAFFLAKDSGRIITNLDAPVSDRTGFALAANGLDAIEIEPGVNARQSMAIDLAASAGMLSGAGTGTIVIKAGANSGVTRILATTTSEGNRTAVTLTLPT